MTNLALSNEACQREVGAVFFCLQDKIITNMLQNNGGVPTQNENSTGGNSRPSKKDTMSSLEMAEISGKPHNDLLKTIRKQEVAWTKVTGGKFSLSEYEDSTGRKLPMYELSKMESLYISSKFNDYQRAKLVVRWYELETGIAKTKIKLHPHERPIFEVLAQWLRKGDIKRVAEQVEVTPNSVSRVKRGVFRSQRIMEALIKRCHYNREHKVVDGYANEALQLNIFVSNQLKLSL